MSDGFGTKAIRDEPVEENIDFSSLRGDAGNGDENKIELDSLTYSVNYEPFEFLKNKQKLHNLIESINYDSFEKEKDLRYSYDVIHAVIDHNLLSLEHKTELHRLVNLINYESFKKEGT